jgi:hypothetical protein
VYGKPASKEICSDIERWLNEQVNVRPVCVNPNRYVPLQLYKVELTNETHEAEGAEYGAEPPCELLSIGCLQRCPGAVFSLTMLHAPVGGN